MKATLILLVIAGAAIAQTPGGNRRSNGRGFGLFGNRVSTMFGSARDRLTNLDISNFANVQRLFNARGTARDLVLQAAANSFVSKFANGLMLEGKSRMEIMQNFIDNAKNILSTPLEPGWTPGLDMEILGLSAQEFSDLLTLRPEENRNGSRGGQSVTSRQKRQAGALPKSIDWREKGAVTPVKNQGKCGSCWAFAAIGALEGRIAVKTGSLPVLSEQHLIDCAKNINGSKCCNGCDGGWMTDAYTFVKLNEGVASDKSYPYEQKDGTCRYDESKKSGESVGFEYTEQDSEEDLMRAVAEGPVAVGVDSSSWSLYKGGVFRCRNLLNMFVPPKINHGVVVVGYGSHKLWGDYWIIKNSWGPSWGENGYIRIARNASNQCGIAGNGNYPLI